MGKAKDRNASTNLMLRDFNLELLESLKKFTGESTGSKAIKLVCARYIRCEETLNKYQDKCHKQDMKLERMKQLYMTAKEASNELNKLMQG